MLLLRSAVNQFSVWKRLSSSKSSSFLQLVTHLCFSNVSGELFAVSRRRFTPIRKSGSLLMARYFTSTVEKHDGNMTLDENAVASVVTEGDLFQKVLKAYEGKDSTEFCTAVSNISIEFRNLTMMKEEKDQLCVMIDKMKEQFSREDCSLLLRAMGEFGFSFQNGAYKEIISLLMNRFFNNGLGVDDKNTMTFRRFRRTIFA
jgi:hypothetical protein